MAISTVSLVMRSMHSNEADYQCPRCRKMVQIGIAHECNYMICHRCNGQGTLGWRNKDVCDWCSGTGKWVQQPDKPEEDNPQGVLVG